MDVDKDVNQRQEQWQEVDALTCSVTMGNYANGMPALSHSHTHVCRRNNIMLLTHCTHTELAGAN